MPKLKDPRHLIPRRLAAVLTMTAASLLAGCSSTTSGSIAHGEIGGSYMAYTESNAPSTLDQFKKLVDKGETVQRLYHADTNVVYAAIKKSLLDLKYDRIFLQYDGLLVVAQKHLGKSFLTGDPYPDRLYIYYHSVEEGVSVDCALAHYYGGANAAAGTCQAMLDQIAVDLGPSSSAGQ